MAKLSPAMTTAWPRSISSTTTADVLALDVTSLFQTTAAALPPPTVAACFSSVIWNAAGEENSRFLSSFRTNSAAIRSPWETAPYRVR